MPRPLNIACLQTRPMPDFRAALDEALPLAEAAIRSGAEVLFLPEYCGGLRSDGPRLAPPSAPEAKHLVLTEFRELAARRGVWINVGSIAVDGPDERIYNRGYMLDDRGDIRGRYDKIHLFDITLSETETYRESATVAPGRRAVLHDTPFARIGHTICYDLRFPQLFRTLAKAGAEIICCPAAFTRRTGEAHWHVLNRARAIENTCFVVSACAIGPIPGGGESYGHSLVVNPWGEVIADGGTLPGVVHAQIELDRVESARSRIPSLSHDRTIRLETTEDALAS
ncbi:2-oxoglutaramate amidase [Defluviimonas aquaemixtae]|uniref:2-oxoglutaramate amidase n=1 Tax=Albidovulum aquaemixtae TaxID=1542388 RepID=A0A2R8B6A2_9RHOB|nr:carbon-nitrogen hydrolase family protein [Defluviimonas aquaemixtae]SPH18155.1 2-oxoglutaramate amidase [Defluviimonas aquaemixtae]